MHSENSRDRILWFFLACFLVALIGLGWLLLPFFPIIILGTVISGIIYPVHRKIEKFLRIRSSLAALVTCLLIFLILFVPIVLFVGSLAQQAFGLYEMAKGAVINEKVNAFLHESNILDRANAVLANFNYALTGDEIRKTVTEIGRVVGLFLYEQFLYVASNTMTFVVNFFLMVLVVFFLLLDGERLLIYILNLSPLPTDQERMLIRKFKEMASAILIGNGLAGIIQGVLGGLLFCVFGLPSAFLWGVVMGILAFIPILGIGLVIVPAAVYLLLTGKIIAGVSFLIFYLIVMVIIEYIFKPKLVGERAKMHPLLVFFAIIGGLKLFGILGIIYGPLVVTAFMTLADIYHINYREMVESREP
ncbi:MAG: AI-2E family transporter [Deltaproteobacteria bacterium]|nr:AI-2E family transporter [Deltaproteobacteria bacterium]